ncbi:MAG: peptide chain release factor-like protein [Kiritimatiellae bacterium]|jgi:protein subunit release factor B|nr:peptide chain release factor-like protein [Kiritimatiellia bacterium]
MISPETVEKIKRRMALASVFEDDIEESFILGSGSGGQKVNKTASTVRLCHEPSQITIKCGQNRSREVNRWLARQDLAEKILEREKSEHSKRIQAREKIRRQKRRRSRKQKAKMLDEKHKHGQKKAARAKVDLNEE